MKWLAGGDKHELTDVPQVSGNLHMPLVSPEVNGIVFYDQVQMLRVIKESRQKFFPTVEDNDSDKDTDIDE